MAARVVTQHGFFVHWHLIQFSNQFFNRQVSKLRQVFQRRVSVVDIGLMVFGVVNLHRLLIEVRFQCIISVRQGWQCITHNHLHYCRAAQC
ncbi:Uncharacterised protein [Salmonella enterica subsp. enterica serovar Bovismorbificans]|uniref:Uncharacterized protein n=1 Tax=Salmonella enterica subsp. enterica serovar Bovismorbificans TaxID=58097 RepID=A0A655BZD0_SALET|nr:Uncharacterised protein [Salmonella enterica subsp. enterica serovar Bovismorbificans]